MVKTGYIQTEIGVLPEDWKVYPLKDLVKCPLTYGINAPAIDYDSSLNQYIRITDISDDGKYITKNKVSINTNEADKYSLSTGDILFARTGASTGKTYIYRESDGRLIYAGFLIKASIDGEKCDVYYIFSQFHVTRYYDWVSVMSLRSGQPGINSKEYASYLIPIPERREQEAIATALSDMDALIDNLEKLIAKKKAIKQGTMQELLTGKRRLPGFMGEWHKKSIGELGSFISGSCFPLSYQGNLSEKYPFYKVSDFNNPGNERQLYNANNYISDDSVQALGCKIIPEHSIVIAKIGAAIFLERKKLTTQRCCIDNNMMAFVPFDETTSEFLCYVFQQIKLSDFIEATALPSLSGKTICTIEKIIPPTIDEQLAIVSVLSDMDNEIEQLEKNLSKYKKIKSGMMSELLTGRIRLV